MRLCKDCGKFHIDDTISHFMRIDFVSECDSCCAFYFCLRAFLFILTVSLSEHGSSLLLYGMAHIYMYVCVEVYCWACVCFVACHSVWSRCALLFYSIYGATYDTLSLSQSTSGDRYICAYVLAVATQS